MYQIILKKSVVISSMFLAGLSLYALPKSVVYDSEITNENKNVKTEARNKSIVNTGVSARSSQIINSTIINENKNTRINAANRSEVNTGIKADNAQIRDSKLKNRFTGNINARNSNVDTGINVSGGNVYKSRLQNDTTANINASNSNVTTGIKVDSASFSDINTKANVNVDVNSSNVNLGTVSGGIHGKTVSTEVNQNISDSGANINVGTVQVGRATPKWQQTKSFGGGKSASVGNVNTNSGRLQEARVTVGSDNLNEKIFVKAMSKHYKGKIAPDGTKYIYVDSKSKNKVLSKGGEVGNYTGNKASKVHTFVE